MVSKAAPVVAAAVISVAVSACASGPDSVGDTTAATSAPHTAARARSRSDEQRARAERAAADAKAVAEAELAANPLVRVFGSELQRQSAAAQARLEQVLAEAPKPSRRVPVRSALQHQADLKERAPSARPQIPTRKAAASTTSSTKPEPAKVATGKPAPAPPKSPGIEVIVYDVAAAIKTVHRTDGSVEEDAFDPASLDAINARAADKNIRVKVVNESAANQSRGQERKDEPSGPNQQ